MIFNRIAVAATLMISSVLAMPQTDVDIPVPDVNVPTPDVDISVPDVDIPLPSLPGIGLGSLGGLNFSECTNTCITTVAQNASTSGLIPASALASLENPSEILSDNTTVQLICTTSVGTDVVGCVNANNCPEASLISVGLEGICSSFSNSTASGNTTTQANTTDTTNKNTTNNSKGNTSGAFSAFESAASMSGIALVVASMAFLF